MKKELRSVESKGTVFHVHNIEGDRCEGGVLSLLILSTSVALNGGL
jgi:hypothetical protein